MKRTELGMGWTGRRGAEVILVLLLCSGCGEVTPLGRRPKSDQFLTREGLAAVAVPGASREDLRQRLGEPFAASPSGRAIGYLRCEMTQRRVLTLALVVPFWATSTVTYFQVQGVWFDEGGKTIQTKIWDGHDGPYGGNPKGRSVPDRAQVLLWLAKEAPTKGL